MKIFSIYKLDTKGEITDWALATRHQEAMRLIIQLWLCRILTAPGMTASFIRKSYYQSDEIAHYLGFSDEDGDDLDGTFNPGKARAKLRRLHVQLEKQANAIQLPEFMERNLYEFGNTLNLEPLEVAIVGLLVMRSEQGVLQAAFSLIPEASYERVVWIIARILNAPFREVSTCLKGGGRLHTLGLIQWDARMGSNTLPELCNRTITNGLLRDDFSLRGAIRAIVAPAPAPTLGLNDYAHIGKLLDYLRPYLRRALNERQVGVNIFVHGAPGTGKSELIRVLAKDLQAALYEISTEDEDGDSNGGEKRLVSLRVAQALLKEQHTLLVFDEAEDIFGASSPLHRSLADEKKGWMNRMLETNPIPTFWVSNRGEGLDPAFMRRYDFVFEVSAPPRKQRKKVMARICGGLLSDRAMERLADCDTLTPAVVARAHHVAQQARSGETQSYSEEMVMDLVRETLKAQGHRTDALDRKSDFVPEVYDTAFLNCDKPLESIINSLQADAACRICLYGPPGTGKTCLGHWLARHLGKPLLLKKASDIISPYIGVTERNLARAFAEARDDQSILLIDEVDTFLQDRRSAVRSWEVSEVNEMLTQMEQFDGIFVASTNLVEGLDRAALRRFDLKLRFDFLLPAQVRALLTSHCRHLGLAIPSHAELDLACGLQNLTPGDFANVARQHRFRNFATPADLITALEDECQMKAGSAHRPAGF